MKFLRKIVKPRKGEKRTNAVISHCQATNFPSRREIPRFYLFSYFLSFIYLRISVTIITLLYRVPNCTRSNRRQKNDRFHACFAKPVISRIVRGRTSHRQNVLLGNFLRPFFLLAGHGSRPHEEAEDYARPEGRISIASFLMVSPARG